MANQGRSKSPDRRPARARYWRSGKLRERKTRNLVRHGKRHVQTRDCCVGHDMMWKDAATLWNMTRERYSGGPTHKASRT